MTKRILALSLRRMSTTRQPASDYFARSQTISDDGPPELGPNDVGEMNSQSSQPLSLHIAPAASPEKARESPEKPGGSPGAIPVGVPGGSPAQRPVGMALLITHKSLVIACLVY